MPSCFMCKRSKNSISKLQNISFHRFPTNQTIRNKWYDFVIENGLKVDNINKNSVLCSRHFDASLLFIHKKTRQLCKNAVPIIKISRVVKSKTVYPEVFTIGQSSFCFLEILSDVLDQNSPALQLPTSEIGCEQLPVSAEQSLQKKKPTILVAENDKCFEGVSVLEENSPVKVDYINLNVLGQDNILIKFRIKKHILLAKLMNVYCEESGLAFNTVKFNFDGRAINEIDTPTSLDLKDDDIIEVFQQQNGSCYF